MEFTGKNLEETIKNGLLELGLTKEDAVIEIVKQPIKGIFGIVKEAGVVNITAKEKKENKKTEKKEKCCEEEKKKENVEGKLDLSNSQKFIEEVFKYLDINAKTVLKEEGENPVIDIIAEKSSEIIGKRGEVLEALQVLTGAVANIGNKNYKKVIVDCENYRGKREDTLIALAHKLEAKATEMRREVLLEPMSPYERRIIHTALAESKTVTTKSEGTEPNRYIIIVPNDKDEFSRPYNAGRNNDKKGGKNHKSSKGNNYSKSKRSGGGFVETKRKTPSGFGTYIGNSLK